MSRLRGGIFGCGMISEFHLRGWNRIPEVQIVALGNRTLDPAEERRREFAPTARIYGDLREMLRSEDLDFVDILTPPALHREHCLIATEAGLHVICQKPLSDDVESARDLVQRMEGHPKLFAVHENHRYRPWFQEILSLHREHFFGEIRFVHIQHLAESPPGERYKLQARDGVLLEYGTHLVDMARALLGEPQRAYARLHRTTEDVHGESWAHVAFEYPDTSVVIDTAWKAGGVLQGAVLVHGTAGEAYFEGSLTRGRQSRFRLVRGQTVILDETRNPSDDYLESFYRFQRACTDAILRGCQVEQTGRENLRTLEATFAAYEAAQQRQIVAVPPAVG